MLGLTRSHVYLGHFYAKIDNLYRLMPIHYFLWLKRATGWRCQRGHLLRPVELRGHLSLRCGRLLEWVVGFISGELGTHGLAQIIIRE